MKIYRDDSLPGGRDGSPNCRTSELPEEVLSREDGINSNTQGHARWDFHKMQIQGEILKGKLSWGLSVLVVFFFQLLF